MLSFVTSRYPAGDTLLQTKVKYLFICTSVALAALSLLLVSTFAMAMVNGFSITLVTPVDSNTITLLSQADGIISVFLALICLVFLIRGKYTVASYMFCILCTVGTSIGVFVTTNGGWAGTTAHFLPAVVFITMFFTSRLSAAFVSCFFIALHPLTIICSRHTALPLRAVTYRTESYLLFLPM
ncbi:MAG: hypothetical protein ACRCUT_12080 [Spirochaetota bacterium]